MSVYSVVLAGGRGSRLWPLSREELPKQFHTLLGHRTLLQQALLRAAKVSERKKIVIVTGQRDGALALHQARQVLPVTRDALLEEPVGRGTAPAIALALAYLLEHGGTEDDLVLVAPSDHLVTDEEAFERAVRQGFAPASEGHIVTFGIRPETANTGFGYIRCAPMKEGHAPVERFVEKPDRERAERYIKEGNCFWNGGLFLFRIGTMFEALDTHAPTIASAARRGYDAMLESFDALPSISIDNAVMEKTSGAAMVELDAGWSDVGSWDALYNRWDKDDDGNVLAGDVLTVNSKDSLFFSPDRLVVGIDLQDMLVVDGGDALLVAPRGSSHRVREAVELLKEQGRREAVEPVETVRPWGRFRMLFSGNGFRAKYLVIEPGKRLSLQYHHHRSEHWIVVRGRGTVSLDGQTFSLGEGESVSIPMGAQHRLENREEGPLEIIETQIGARLREDDIVRLDDDYAR